MEILNLDDDKDEEEGTGAGDETKTAAKKKKKKKKPTTNGTAPVAPTPVARPQQTNPPSIPIADLYPDGNFPEGQILEHPTPKNPPTDG